MPRAASIGTDLDTLNTTITREGNTTNLDVFSKGYVSLWPIYTTDSMEWTVVPALIRVQASDKVVGQLNTRQPLGILLTKAAWYQDTHGEAMLLRQLRTIHAPGQQRIYSKYL